MSNHPTRQPRYATARLPAWMWGGDLKGLAAAAGWEITADESAAVYQVRLARPTNLLKLHKLLHSGNVDSPGSVARLRSLPPHDVYLTVPTEIINSEIARVGSGPRTAGAAMYQASLVTSTSRETELPDALRFVLKNQLFPVLQDASVWLLEVDQRLTRRYVFARALLQFEDSPELAPPEPDQFVGFSSGRALLNDTLIGLSAYLAPLFLSHVPYVWGFSAGRAGAVIMYNLGTAVVGHTGSTTEPLQLFHPHGPVVAQPRPDLSPLELDAALKWWIGQLNQLFHVATDPTNYLKPNGQFSVRRQFERLLSIEQAFRNVQSLSALHRDSHARRLICFDTLDTLEGMQLLSFAEMTRLSRAEAELAALEASIPSLALPVLIPRARRAVEALRRLQGGFFLPSRVTTDGVRLPDKRQGEIVLPLEKAVSAWLRVLRNAGHAFGGKEKHRDRDEALLLAHSGDVPGEFPDLAYLYLLRLVANPSMLRQNAGSVSAQEN